MKDRIFIDTDVIIDIAIARKPFFESAASLLSQIEAGSFDGYTSSVIFTNVFWHIDLIDEILCQWMI